MIKPKKHGKNGRSELAREQTDVSLCRQCGRCCWDWKNNDPANRCNHLADDLRTCLAYGRRAEVNRAECDRLMDIHQAVDLHPDCGYMQEWRRQGLV